MAYKYATGSVQRGDIYNEDDAQGNTYIDWNEDALGVVAGGTTNFVVSASNVGIGTASPSSSFALDIPVSASTVRMGRLELGAWPTSTEYGFIGHSYQDHHGSGRHLKYNIAIGSGGDLSLNAVAGNDMYFRIGGVMKAGIDSNGFFGIGPNAGYDWTPSAQLHVSSSDDEMAFLCHDAQQNPVLAVTGSNRVGIGTSSPDSLLHVSSSGDEALLSVAGATNGTVLFVTGSGRVGIGTDSPSEALSVIGDISGSGDLLLGGKIGLGNKQDVTPSAMLHISSSYTQTNPLVQIEAGDDGEDGAQLLIKGNMQPSSQATATLIELNSNIDYRARGIHLTCDDGNEEWFAGVPYPGARYQIGFDGTNGKPWRLNSSSFDILESGDVGIGTAGSPAAKLHVIDTGEVMRLGYDASNYTIFNISSDGTLALTTNDSSADLNLYPASILRLGTQYTDNVYVGRTDTTSDTIIYGGTSGAEVMRIDGSADSVGIGTASPSKKLHVSGSASDASILIASDAAAIELYPASGPALRFGTPASTYSHQIYGTYSGKHQIQLVSNLDFQISGAKGGVGYYFDQSEGNVGIGTATPNSTFQVSGSQAGNYTQAAGNFTFDETHYIVDYTGDGDATFTLPDVSGITGRVYHIISHNQSEEDVDLTVTGSGGQFQSPSFESGDQDSIRINGNTPQSITVVSTGGNWFVLNDNRAQEH